jgi:NitT/TauT family transport system ATP-binding protein
MVSLGEFCSSYPAKLSGGQRQRASIARAFAYPSDMLLMDEPFQSLDIPLRIELMDLCVGLLEKEKRLTVVVTHDPREAVYMGSRIIILSSPPKGIIFDERVNLSKEERSYGEAAAGELEKRLIEKLKLSTKTTNAQ